VNKKERERRKRKIADEESKARGESEDRQAKIKVLWQDLEKEARRLKRERADQDELDKDELVEILTELAPLQKDEIEYLTQFRRDWERISARYRKQLESLSGQTLSAQFDEWIKTGAIKLPKRTPKQQYEYKRHKWLRGDVGLIESQFGGAMQAELEKSIFTVGIVFEPTCLDGIFAGDGGVHMWRLQELFGMNRNRFPSNLPSFEKEKRSEKLYGYRAVVKIMEALLGDKPRERKGPARGSPLRLWLSDRDLRMRVLGGIKVRIQSIPVQEKIKTAFLAVVHRHLPDSAKK
jgi:hypothetical protein